MPLSKYSNKQKASSSYVSKKGDASSSKGKQIEDSLVAENDAERVSDQSKVNLRRNSCEPDESECPTDYWNEDVEKDPAKIEAMERKMTQQFHRLEEIVPNSTKGDTLALLEEACEHLKEMKNYIQIKNTINWNSYMTQMMQQLSVASMKNSNSFEMGLKTETTNMSGESHFPLISGTQTMVPQFDGPSKPSSVYVSLAEPSSPEAHLTISNSEIPASNSNSNSDVDE